MMYVWHQNTSVMPVWHLNNSKVSVWHLKSGSTPTWRHQETVWSRSQCVSMGSRVKERTEHRPGKRDHLKAQKVQESKSKIQWNRSKSNNCELQNYEFSISWGTNQKRDLGQSKNSSKIKRPKRGKITRKKRRIKSLKKWWATFATM